MSGKKSLIATRGGVAPAAGHTKKPENNQTRDSTAKEIICCRCGKETLFYTIAPYGSVNDGDPICAACIDKPAPPTFPAVIRLLENELEDIIYGINHDTELEGDELERENDKARELEGAIAALGLKPAPPAPGEEDKMAQVADEQCEAAMREANSAKAELARWKPLIEAVEKAHSADIDLDVVRWCEKGKWVSPSTNAILRAVVAEIPEKS